MSVISTIDYFKGHGGAPPDVQENAQGLIEKVNALLEDSTCPVPSPGIRSGWRPVDYNKTFPGAAPNSKHITGHAIDLNDNDAQLDDWISQYDSPDLRDNDLLAQYGLYREHPAATKSWCHLQDLPPNSGHRTFYP